jgi:hypothetical protein
MKDISNRLFGALAMVSALAACSDGSAPGAGGQVSLNVATHASGAAPSRPFASPDTIVDGGGNVLVLTRVELVLREIELKRQNDDACDSLSSGEDDSCEEFETGPILLDLPLGAGVSHQITIAVDSGTFDEIEFEIHKPEDDGDANDQAFLAAHPELKDVSIRVTGSFNGTDFVFITDLNAEQEATISPPLVVSAESSVDVTLMVDVSSWFLNGAVVIDPVLGLKGGSLENLVKSNIEASFEAFHDDDHDGHSDDD